MDTESRWVYEGPPRSPIPEYQPTECILCRIVFCIDEDMVEGFESLYMLCRDCKFAILDDLATTAEVSGRMSPVVRRRSRNRSSESIEGLFSQQFSQLINLVRQNRQAISRSTSEHGSLRENENSTRVLQDLIAYSRPGRGRSAFSDNGSEGFDNLDSVLGESDTNGSFSGYGPLYWESDAVSFSGYGGNSEVSMDGQSLPDRELFAQWDDNSHFDSETDIDPMNAGLDHWDSNEDEEEEDDDWEEVDAEGDETVGTERLPANRELNLLSPRNGALNTWRMQETVSDRPLYREILNLERELIEQFAETASLTWGPPPAALSIISNLPRVVITKDHEKSGVLVCAVCKDQLEKDTVANQLPCLHLYHPMCILPWLSSRNSCPVCRYELPTDDLDYEEGKLRSRNRAETPEVREEEQSRVDLSVSEESGFPHRQDAGGGAAVVANIDEQMNNGRGDLRTLVDASCSGNNTSGGHISRGRWLLLAAGPIISVVGIVLVLWFGNPMVGGSGSVACRGGREQEQRLVQGASLGSSSGLVNEGRGRKWWYLF